MRANDNKANCFYACEYYRWRLASSRSKYGQQYFNHLAADLEKEYLDADGKLDYGKAEKLVRRKAERYFTRHVFRDAAYEWWNAERYVKAFYENIIPAVSYRDGHETAKRRIVEAILQSEGPDSPLSVMNAFEAAIAIYFLKDLKGLPDEWYGQAAAFEEKLRKEETGAHATS